MHIMCTSAIPLSKKRPLHWIITFLLFSFPFLFGYQTSSPHNSTILWSYGTQWKFFHNLKCHKLTLWMWRRWHAMKAWQTLLARGCLDASWLETCREALKSFAGEQSYFSCLTSLFFQASFVILSLVKQNCSSRSFCGSSEGIGL